MKNEDLRSIAYSSKASQDSFEMWQLLENVERIKPQRILEIGMDKGHSLFTWHKAFPNALVAGIDRAESSFDDMYKTLFLSGHVNNVKPIFGDSHNGSMYKYIKHEVFGGDFVDFLFIDGDHTYEGVKRDWQIYAPMVRPGGFVALHDTKRIGEKWAGNVEVRRFADEMQQKFPSIEIWNGPKGDNGPGTILFKWELDA